MGPVIPVPPIMVPDIISKAFYGTKFHSYEARSTRTNFSGGTKFFEVVLSFTRIPLIGNGLLLWPHSESSGKSLHKIMKFEALTSVLKLILGGLDVLSFQTVFLSSFNFC